ncbi:signal transduction histidine kinase [Nonomuraea endophytica]|uniref:histidine kinase n=1 Tax=Nonomuraea endophytica TaxID=714136 RepID=A0A7W8AFG9_9ACTN|nr:signal transduction histidine kinase [Nonomuraea endophytica]
MGEDVGPRFGLATSAERAIDATWVGITAAVNVGGVVVVAVHDDDLGRVTPGVVLLLMIGPALLWWRRRDPWLVLAGCVAVTWTYILGGLPPGPVYGPMIVALVSAVVHGARWAAYLVVIATLAVHAGAGLLPGWDGRDGWDDSSLAALAAWLLFLLAFGELIRHRHALTEERRRRRQAGLDAHADQLRREAAEDRLDLARELHDVVGHHLAVINIQAAAGLHLHATQRPGVEEALRVVREASGRALSDVQVLLDALRNPGHAASRLPSPSLSDIDGLLDSARAGGLDVEVVVTGEPRSLPAAHDLVAGRVILESLTNVLRHAGRPRTWVRIDYRPERLCVRVDNAAPTPEAARTPGGGRGIPGMRARVETCGGTLTAGPLEPFAWSVRAILPIQEQHR